MKEKLIKLIVIVCVLLFIVTPLLMWLAWKYSEKKKIDIFILDKTVLNRTYQEHLSFNWVLNNNRFVKTNGHNFLPGNDYYGFFPDERGGYDIYDLESKSNKELEQLSYDYDMVYYIDLYGIYWAEWHSEYPYIKPEQSPFKVGERSELLYGGLTENELEFLKLMKAQKKLIINEFNIIASPTSYDLRKKYEKEFDINWSGWTGRYFASLDTNINKELPVWLVRNYKEQNNKQWPFKKSGIAFVRNDDKIVILENQTHLKYEIPMIITNSDYLELYDLPRVIKYSFWFDICSTGPKNDVISEYHILSNNKGDSILEKWNIPKDFPAVIKSNQDYPYFYFAGDFADNPISMRTSHYKYIKVFDFLFYKSVINERKSFFWLYYRPLLTKILKDYYKTISPK
ncbi:MAG: hypothetical protein WCT23_06200 [Candidatus Neomarinimicrobiota bacterium]